MLQKRLGLITEVTEESYKVKFMGYYVNEIEMYIMVDHKLGEFIAGKTEVFR